MAYQIKLNGEEQKELIKRKRNERDGKVLRRLMCVDMKQRGVSHDDIAGYCGVCIDTITDWICLFNEGGFEALCNFKYEGRRMSKLEKYKTAIREKQDKEGIETLKELKDWMSKEYGVETCISNLYYFCKKTLFFLEENQSSSGKKTFSGDPRSLER